MNAMNDEQVLTDIASVCQTLRAFIRMGLVNRARRKRRHTEVIAKTRRGDGAFRSHAGLYIEILWKL